MTRAPVVIVRTHLVPPRASAWVPVPRRVLVRPQHATDERLIAHELQHVLQHERIGRAFLLVYVWQWVRVGFRYRAIPLEVEARRAESEPSMRAWAAELIRGSP